MKNSLLTLILFCSLFSLQAQNVVFNDPNLKAALVANTTSVNLNNDTEIQLYEAQAVGYLYLVNENISDLTGLEEFVNLEGLTITDNNVSTIDLTPFPKLIWLRCSNNQLTTIQFPSTLTTLEDLQAANNQLTSLVLPDTMPNVETINVSYNQLTNLDLSKTLLTRRVHADYNQLSNLIEPSIGSTILTCSHNNLSKVTLTKSYDYVDIGNNPLDSFTLATAILVQRVFCDSSQLRYIELNNNTDSLDCSYNLLDTIAPLGVSYLICKHNNLKFFYSNNTWTDLDLSDNNLEQTGIYDNFSNNNIFNANLSNNPNLNCIETNANISNAQSNWVIPNGATVATLNGCLPIWSSTSYLNNLPNTSLYPNPTYGQVQLELGNTYDEVSIEVFNSIGQRVQNVQLQQVAQASIDLPTTVGIYMIQVQTEKGRATFKVVKK